MMRIATLGAFGASLLLAPAALAQTAQPLPFLQDWTNVGQITADNVWTGVPGVIGYRGDDLVVVGATTDARTILLDGSATPVNVLANKTSPNTETSGGVFEFEIADPVVAFQGSGTADVPHLVIRVVTTGLQNIRVRYNLRDIDGSADNSVQPVALQFRAGTTGDYTNVEAGYVADASTGPNLATQVTAVEATLPAAANNQASVDVRILTYNALGSDEFIGIDDIQITSGTGTSTGETPAGGLTLAVANPLRGVARVAFASDAPEATLALYDVLRRRVATLAAGAGTGSATLDTAGLAPGVYVLRLTVGANRLTRTVTVVR